MVGSVSVKEIEKEKLWGKKKSFGDFTSTSQNKTAVIQGRGGG
jgi:hypothetical protein